MAILTSLWGTLLGNRTSRSGNPLKDSAVKPVKVKSTATSPASPAAKSKTQAAIPAGGSLASSLANHNPNHIEKHKLRSTRTQMEAQPVTKLDLKDLRARIHSDSQDYIDMRQRQKSSISHWFGKRSTGIDEVALTERLAAPIPTMPVSQDEIDLTLNFGDIHLPDYYDSQLINVEDFAVAEEFAAMPPLVALSDDIPELEELLARLQIMESVVSLEESLALDPLSWSAMEQNEISSVQSADSSECYLADDVSDCAEHHADLHLVSSLALISPEEEIDEHAPVQMIKHRSKGKKSRRARNKEAARMKAEA